MESPQKSLPDEIIFQILSFCSPLDIVRRARLVSKQFRDITYDRELWKTIYKSARLPRPSGPYPFQSANYLERTLVQSARLAQSWTSEPLQVISCTEIVVQKEPSEFFVLISGRWVVECEMKRKIVLYDAKDPRPVRRRRVVWEKPDQREKKGLFPFFRGKNIGQIFTWNACSAMSVEGEFMYVIIGERSSYSDSSARWNLLKFKMNGDSSLPVFCGSFNIPASINKAITAEFFSHSSLLLIRGLTLLFDTKTQIFYNFPMFRTELYPQGARIQDPQCILSVLLTASHILVFRCGHEPRSYLVQAFTLPDDPHPLPNCTCALRLTHECRVYIRLDWLLLIRDSIIDPLTGSTRIRVLNLTRHGSQFHFSCLDCTLPRSHTDTILPISTNTHEVFTINTSFLPDPAIRPVIATSDDGHVRGLCKIHECSPEYYIVKFTIDATGDECIPTVGELVRMEGRLKRLCSFGFYVEFDGIRGNTCHKGSDIKCGKGYRMGPYLVLDIK